MVAITLKLLRWCYLQTRWGMMGNSSALGSGIPAPSGISSPSSDSCRQNRRWAQVRLSSRCINNLEERKKPQGAARALEKASVGSAPGIQVWVRIPDARAWVCGNISPNAWRGLC